MTTLAKGTVAIPALENPSVCQVEALRNLSAHAYPILTCIEMSKGESASVVTSRFEFNLL